MTETHKCKMTEESLREEIAGVHEALAEQARRNGAEAPSLGSVRRLPGDDRVALQDLDDAITFHMNISMKLAFKELYEEAKRSTKECPDAVRNASICTFKSILVTDLMGKLIKTAMEAGPVGAMTLKAVALGVSLRLYESTELPGYVTMVVTHRCRACVNKDACLRERPPKEGAIGEILQEGLGILDDKFITVDVPRGGIENVLPELAEESDKAKAERMLADLDAEKGRAN